MGKTAPLFEIIYQTVQDEKNNLSVETLCDIAAYQNQDIMPGLRQFLTDNVGKRKTEQILD